MKRKPHTFNLTESGFQALGTCKKKFPHLGRGLLVSLAIEKMAQQAGNADPGEHGLMNRNLSKEKGGSI